jgi:hypothetical protein
MITAGQSYGTMLYQFVLKLSKSRVVANMEKLTVVCKYDAWVAVMLPLKKADCLISLNCAFATFPRRDLKPETMKSKMTKTRKIRNANMKFYMLA